MDSREGMWKGGHTRVAAAAAPAAAAGAAAEAAVLDAVARR